MSSHFERLLIVADDLTGALDTAAPFAATGRKVIVVADQRFLHEAIAGDADVITVTTRSREIPAGEAASRVAAIKDALTPGIRLFKKVDSRLKGNLEAELAAVGFERAVVLPGIPEFGRFVTGGMITGFGVETPISIAGRLGALATKCRFPDTQTPEDMHRIANSIAPDELLVGALSLARAIAGTGNQSSLTYPSKRLLMAIGSRDPITIAQVEVLKAKHPDLAYIPAPNGAVELGVKRHAEAAITVIQPLPSQAQVDPPHVAAALATSVAQLAQDGDVILLSGGATAEAYFDDQNIPLLRFSGEALPGLPVAEFNGTFYITKSGGFGRQETLLLLADAITGGETSIWAR